jgi:hypothetical protein
MRCVPRERRLPRPPGSRALRSQRYYWHYDVLRALDYFRGSGADPDPRMAEAVALVESKRQPDGRWLLDRIHPGRVHFDLEGGVGTPSRWNTLRALRVLKWWAIQRLHQEQPATSLLVRVGYAVFAEILGCWRPGVCIPDFDQDSRVVA